MLPHAGKTLKRVQGDGEMRRPKMSSLYMLDNSMTDFVFLNIKEKENEMFIEKRKTDRTLERNSINHWKFLIKEYELVKQKKHPQFRFASDFYKYHKTNRQNFLKYYHRFKNSLQNEALLPQKRGPKYNSRRPNLFIENKVIEQRKKGINRYEIHDILKEKLKQFTPSPSGIYNICKRYGLNKLTKKMKENKRKIIKKQAGELGHIDCHYLPRGIIENNNDRLYFVAIIDDCTRIAWCEVVQDIQSLTVMFAIMRCLKAIKATYDISFEEVMTDNGPEFGGNTNKESTNPDKNIMTNPVKRLFFELGLKHRKIKPYRPQTNGKIERFWRTIDEDFVEGSTFGSLQELEEELFKYMIYYNEYRPHQGINGMKPIEMLKTLQTNIDT